MRSPIEDDAITGNQLTGPHEKYVPNLYPRCGDVLDFAVFALAVRKSGRGLFEQPHCVGGTAGGIALERLTSALHEDDHQPRERLLQGNSCNDGK
jgi:hypothetical protein